MTEITDKQLQGYIKNPPAERLEKKDGKHPVTIRVEPTGKITFTTRGKVGGKFYRKTLGTYPNIKIAKARAEAHALTRTARRIEHPDPRHSIAEIEELAGVVASLLQLLPEIVEEERVQHLQDVRHARIVHAQRSALLIVRNGLDHRPKYVRIDLPPVKTADVEQVGSSDLAESGSVSAAAEKLPVHVRELHRVAGQLRSLALGRLGVHRSENLTNDRMCVRGVPCAHLIDCGGEQPFRMEYVSVLGEKAENQASHEVVHVSAAFIRSAFRSCEVNGLGNEKGHNCASNERNYASHIWDRRDAEGHMGATACIVVNSFVPYYERTDHWEALAWWVHDHLPYSTMTFFPKLAAFNLRWHEQPARHIKSEIPPRKGTLTKPGMANFEGVHSDSYAEWLREVEHA